MEFMKHNFFLRFYCGNDAFNSIASTEQTYIQKKLMAMPFPYYLEKENMQYRIWMVEVRLLYIIL